MLESTSLASLEELDQFLKNLSERLTYLEKVVLPSRVTKEELHTAVSGAKMFVMTTDGKLRADIRMLKDQHATKALGHVGLPRGLIGRPLGWSDRRFLACGRRS
jgi:hypothetical protein